MGEVIAVTSASNGAVTSAVVNPFVEVYALLSELPAGSFTAVVTLILYVVCPVRFDKGLTTNVLLEFDTVVEEKEDIIIQEVKLFDDNCKLPEQEVFEVLVETVELSIVSENVTEIDEPTEIVPEESLGEIDDIVGTVVSIVNDDIISVLLRFPAESKIFTVQSE